MSTPKVTVRRVSAHVVEAEKIVARLAALCGVKAPGLILGSTDTTRQIAHYAPPGYYRGHPHGLIVLRRDMPRGLVSLVCHEFQHHLDYLNGVRCANPRSRHDDAFFARMAKLEARYLASRQQARAAA